MTTSYNLIAPAKIPSPKYADARELRPVVAKSEYTVASHEESSQGATGERTLL
jgi:hypothetical protein